MESLAKRRPNAGASGIGFRIAMVTVLAASLVARTAHGENRGNHRSEVGKISAQSVITLDFRDASVESALRFFADTGRVNIVLAKGVTGRVSLSLSNVTWERAFEMLLWKKELRASREGNVIYVQPLVSRAR